MDAELPALAQQEVPAVLETLRALTSVDSGTGQAPGIGAVADQIERFARSLGGEVQRVTPAGTVAGPNLVITFKGTGKRKIMLMSHMDTVYVAGTAAARPFRIDGNRAIAPGIADDKGGIAVFLHAMKLLKARGFQDYERVTMVFNSDEERASGGSRDLIRSQAALHDAVMSGEPTSTREGLVLATSGAGFLSARLSVGGPSAGADERPVEELADLVLRTRDLQQQLAATRMNWTVMRAENTAGLKRLPAADYQFRTITYRIKGRASHAGGAPELGVNAVVEAAALVKRTTEAAAQFPSARLHWRSASGGVVPNVIPDRGLAVLEVAVPKAEDAGIVTSELAKVGSQPLLAGAEITSDVTQGVADPEGGTSEAFVSADVRVPHADTFAELTRLMRGKLEQKKFASSSFTLRDGLVFPPFNSVPEAQRLAAVAQQIYEKLGAKMEIYPRIYGGTDAAWAGQSGRPVLEGMGLPGENYHSSEEEYVLIDRIPKKLALVAEMIRAIASQP
jgi:acetylornithine deacetylase/succinyl-diaminopimelate desuccinylase-like protein